MHPRIAAEVFGQPARRLPALEAQGLHLGRQLEHHAQRMERALPAHGPEVLLGLGRFHRLGQPSPAGNAGREATGLRREEKERRQREDEDEHRPRHDPRRQATVDRAAGAGSNPRSLPPSTRAPSRESNTGRRVAARRTDIVTTTSPPTAAERSSFRGTSSSARNPIATGAPERITVRPACVAAHRAASADLSPAVHASR